MITQKCDQNQGIIISINSFPFKIQSFLFEGQVNKNNSVRKINYQMNNINNTNPFFEYVNNNKSASSLGVASVNQEEIKKINQLSQIVCKQGQRKNSEILTDPRRPPSINHLSQQLPKSVQQPKKLSTETRPQNDDLKQRRSRSRDERLSRNRDNSQQNNKKQKKEEHFHKTKLCPLYQKGECKKGAQCHFAHGFKQLRGLPNFYKTRLCLSFQKGQCKKPSSQCKYAHGQGELRDLKHDAGYSNTVSQMSNAEKVKQKDDREDYFDDKKRNNDRDSRDNRKDRNKKDRRDRQSQSSHRKDKSRKVSHNRDGSYDRKKKNQKVVQNPLSYKKNIPLNKQYEKFLYADADNKAPQTNSNQFTRYEDSMYMIPTGYVQPPTTPYKPEMYNFNPQKQTEKINLISYPPVCQQQNFPQYTTKPYNEFSKSLSYNYTNQKSNSKQFYQNSVNKKSQQGYSYPNPQDLSIQRVFTHQNTYNVPISQPHASFSNEYPSFYQPSNEFVPNFSKDSYQGYTNSKFSDQQKYRNESNGQRVFSKDTGFSNDFIYPQGQRNLPSGGFIYEKQPQNFYKDDSFYPSSSMKKNDTNFLTPMQPASNNYQASYSNNGVFDLYPALDNKVNPTQGQKYPYPYEKSRYSSGFSNNLQK